MTNKGLSTETKEPTFCVPLELANEMDEWLLAFIREAEHDTAILRENGADGPATARTTLVRKLAESAHAHLAAKLSVSDAARVIGCSEETIRRMVRRGTLTDERAEGCGHIRVRRGELTATCKRGRRPYDPIADAQDVAKLRRTAA